MYFNNNGKNISTIIKSHNESIINSLFDIHFSSIRSTRTELQYFRNFFPALENYMNSLNIPGVWLKCRTKEIHGSPLVTYGIRKTCELGDYFIVVKYKMNGILIGKKIIIYQLKRSHSSSWSINQKQLMFLKDWPTFNFGRSINGLNSFNLRPTRPEYGSFVLINDLRYDYYASNLYGTAYDVFNNQIANRIRISDADKFCYCGLISYFNLLTWEIGEPIASNTDITDFTSALYRYLDWNEDPPDEFVKFKKKGAQHGFWGVEITVESEGNSSKK